MPARKVKLEIGGASYVVSTDDPEEYLVGLAERLDHDINRMLIETPNASVTAAAVITALSYLDEAEKNAFGADRLRTELQGYLADAAYAKNEAEAAKKEVERLRRELAFYERKASADAKGAQARDSRAADEAAPDATAPDDEDPAGQDLPNTAPEEDLLFDAGQLGLDDL